MIEIHASSEPNRQQAVPLAQIRCLEVLVAEEDAWQSARYEADRSLLAAQRLHVGADSLAELVSGACALGGNFRDSSRPCL
jgi:hypothetical protein